MSEYAVEVSKDAQSDIVSIYEYIKDELMNPTAATKFIEDTDEAVTSLESFPYGHMVRPDSKLFGGKEKRQYFYRKKYVCSTSSRKIGNSSGSSRLRTHRAI